MQCKKGHWLSGANIALVKGKNVCRCCERKKGNYKKPPKKFKNGGLVKEEECFKCDKIILKGEGRYKFGEGTYCEKCGDVADHLKNGLIL